MIVSYFIALDKYCLLRLGVKNGCSIEYHNLWNIGDIDTQTDLFYYSEPVLGECANNPYIIASYRRHVLCKHIYCSVNSV